MLQDPFPPAPYPMPSDDLGLIPDPRHFLIPVGETRHLGWLKQRGYDLSVLRFEEKSFLGLDNLNPCKPSLDGETLTLPCSGIYLGQANDKRVIFIALPDSLRERVSLCFTLMSTIATGSSEDNLKICEDMRPVITDLMLNPEPLRINCGPVSSYLHCVLDHAGVYSREIRIANTDEPRIDRQGHIFLETFLEDINSWQAIDAHYGLLFRPGLSALVYALMKWDHLEPFLEKVVPKNFFKLEDLSTYNPDNRLLTIQLPDDQRITLDNEHLDPSLYAKHLGHIRNNIYKLPFDEFCRVAKYPGTIFTPNGQISS